MRPPASRRRVRAGQRPLRVQPDHAVVVRLAPVDHARDLMLGVQEEVEVVADQLHLEQRLVEAHRYAGMHLLPHHQRPVAVDLDPGHGVPPVPVRLGVAVLEVRQHGRRLVERARRVLAVVHPLAVRRLAELGHQLVQRQIEGRRLVLRRGLGPDHRAPGPYGDLHPAGLVVLALVALRRELDLDPDDPVVELLQPGDLLRHVGAELLGHVAVAGLDDNIHAYLTRPTEVGAQGVATPADRTMALPPPTYPFWPG